ncbi:MAG: DUF1667 domain-containing protein [Clostridium sp.]|uniref:DUF1667 domain-containing protein n=1 Tax=Clostridium sp. TaxID=1506 RepID=UPI003073045C
MKILTCIVCPNGCELTVENKEEQWIIQGNLCKRGEDFAINEMKNPMRSVCSTVKTIYREHPRLSVRTDGDIPAKEVISAMKALSQIVINHPVACGEIIVENFLSMNVNLIATNDLMHLSEEVK